MSPVNPQFFDDIAEVEDQIFTILDRFLRKYPQLQLEGIALDFDGDEGEEDALIGVSLEISEAL
ncbi:hypothetical protein [Chrysiogenes arsenatis]|uniref:hypothetical protein n=1 Tax=Chrysiogenes arsenatis TaxID=309797 RepID=UPI0003FDDD23|nr:hypothetical protein [Chrysiogenes arsenatis]